MNAAMVTGTRMITTPAQAQFILIKPVAYKKTQDFNLAVGRCSCPLSPALYKLCDAACGTRLGHSSATASCKALSETTVGAQTIPNMILRCV